jgi:hypothetical protein
MTPLNQNRLNQYQLDQRQLNQHPDSSESEALA